MQRIGVLYNPLSEPSVRLSIDLTEWLQARGLEVWRGQSHEGREEPEALSGMELLVALGGDGTVLRGARPGILMGIPVLPVAMGHLSFMAELGPEELYDGLAVLLEGGGWHDERTLIAATVRSEGATPRNLLALNEVVLARGDLNRVVTVEIEIYNARLTSYHADGVIVATAT